MIISPFFNTSDDSVYDTVKWSKRDARITDADGKIIFEMKDVEVPEQWSQLATDIAASKYFRKAGVPNEKGHEYSVKQLISRIVNTITDYGDNNDYFNRVSDAMHFKDDLAWLLLHQYGAFNSPVWFNVGLWHEYKIEGGGHNYAWDKGTDDYLPLDNQYKRPQASACFIQEVKDSLEDIFKLISQEASIFKYGSGSGSNMSNIRGANEKLSGGGYSSGLMSFLKVMDSAAGAIKSGGTTRRAAVMRCLDADHPEIMDFIDWKMKEEKKAEVLIKVGYDSDFNGEAYATVSGQNSNNSVRLTDEFMKALEEDGDWNTVNRTDGKIYKTYKAREIFDRICKAAHKCADPGIQYDTTINDWHTCPKSGRIESSNPCSEYMFLNNTSCNLASLNLIKFNTKDGFDTEAFKAACRIFFIAQDILVDLGSYPTYEIAKNSHEFRPLGLGYANLGTLLMMHGYPYDSDKGRSMAAAITGIMTGHAYTVSAEMAKDLKAFKQYDRNADAMRNVMKKHYAAAGKGQQLDYLEIEAEECWRCALFEGSQYGYRNSQATVLAPTGTIALLMDCATTGVEPAFSLVMWKKLAGGGVIPMVNQSIKPVLEELGYPQLVIEKIKKYILENSTIEDSSLHAKHLSIFDCAMPAGKGQRFISPMGHVQMTGAVQPFISGAISKTINMPSDSTVEDIAEIYTQSWHLGLKAIAIYRDGSKSSQPLNTSPETEEKDVSAASPVLPRQIPDQRHGYTWELKIGGSKLFLRSGEFEDGTLGEIFIDLGYKEGSTIRSLMNQFAISISLGLQQGVSLEKLVDKFSFTKFEPHGLVQGHPYLKSATSLVDAIFRVLGHHYLGREDFLQIKPARIHQPHIQVDPDNIISPVYTVTTNAVDSELFENLCNDCGGPTTRTGTCVVCTVCGESQGCS